MTLEEAHRRVSRMSFVVCISDGLLLERPTTGGYYLIDEATNHRLDIRNVVNGVDLIRSSVDEKIRELCGSPK